MKIVDIIYWVLNVFMVWALIYGVVLRLKTKKVLKWLKETDKKRDSDYDEFITKYTERLTLLSEENNKLREENEVMKERLTNLGLYNE